MTLLDCNKLLAIFLLTATVLGVTACSEEPDSKLSVASPSLRFSTSLSDPGTKCSCAGPSAIFPHQGQQLGRSRLWFIAVTPSASWRRDFTVRGEQAKYFGATEANSVRMPSPRPAKPGQTG